MRLAPPPPDTCLGIPAFAGRHAHDALLHALAQSLAALDAHAAQVALALDLGDAIDLPPGAPNALDQAALQAAAPLYFASELESAGLLPTAELIAGLFASGTINQPLGPGAQLLNAFWRARHERLGPDERHAIFARVIEAPHFDRLMAALCSAIVAQAGGGDSAYRVPLPGPGVRERVALESAVQALGEFLAQRVDPMAAMAAHDIVGNINAALAFMRDRLLQAAFGVQSLWALVAVANAGAGATAAQRPDANLVQQHVEQGRAGQTVLLWLAAHAAGPVPALDAGKPDDFELIGAAQRWLSGRITTPATTPAVAPALPIAA